MKHHAQLLLVIAIAVSAAGCALSRNPVTGNKRALGYTWAQERQLGAEADQQIVRQFGVYDDRGLQAYVDNVAQRVLAESHLRRPDAAQEFRETPFTFRVLDSEVVNAFALPGGYVYVTRGLLAHLDNEAQLAMVLGHEIGHVAARHAAQRAFEQQLGQIGLLGGAILGQQVLGIPAQDLLNLGGAATQLLFLKYGREDEMESDRLGVEYSALANYQAGEGAEFFRSLERIQEQQDQAIPAWASTHPEPWRREEVIRELAAEWADRAQMTVLDADEYLEALSNMIVGPNPRQGFVRNDVFYHPDLRFQFPVPNGFRTVNQATQVIMVQQNNEAMIGFQLADAASPAAAAQAFARQEGLQVVDSGSLTSNGLPASYVVADAQTQQGQIVRAIAYFVQHDGQVYSYVAYTPRDLWSRYERAFLNTLRGFAPLTDRGILNVQPTRLEIVRAPRTAPFRAFLPATLPEGITAEDLAIMNQVELDESIPQGTPLKLVD